MGTAIAPIRPPASRRSEGDTVVLASAAGPGQTAVPDVTGEQEDAARADLARADFKVKVDAAGQRQRGRGGRDQPGPRGRQAGHARQHGHDRGLERPGAGARCPTSGAARRARPSSSSPTGDSRSGTSAPRRAPRSPPASSCARTRRANASRPKGTPVNITVAVAPANVPVPERDRQQRPGRQVQARAGGLPGHQRHRRLRPRRRARSSTRAPPRAPRWRRARTVVITVSNGPTRTPPAPAGPSPRRRGSTG